MDPAQSPDPNAELAALLSQDGIPAPQHSEQPAESQQQQSQQMQDVPPGVQTRFGEMTAARRQAEAEAAEYKRRYEETQNQVQQLSMQVAQLATVKQAPSAEEVEAQRYLAEMDPAAKRAFDFTVKQAVSNVHGQVAQMSAQLREMKMSQMGSKYSEPVVKRAVALMNVWSQTGRTGWIEEDALKYAAGEFLDQGINPLKAQQARRQDGRFASQELPRAGAPDVSQGQMQQSTPSWAEPGSRDFDAARSRQYYEQKLGNKSF